jgi:hypothetical protein
MINRSKKMLFKNIQITIVFFVFLSFLLLYSCYYYNDDYSETEFTTIDKACLPSSSSEISILYSNNSIYVIYDTWEEMKIAKSIDNGKNWTIKNIDSTESSDLFAITADKEKLYFTYYDYNKKNLYFLRSNDGAETWSKPFLVDEVGYLVDYLDNLLSIDYYENNIYISYVEENYPYYDLKLAVSTDGGNNWTNVKTVFKESNQIYDLLMKVDGSNIYLSYYDYKEKKLKFLKSDNCGLNWTSPFIIDSDISSFGKSFIKLNQGTIYISYCELIDDNDYLKIAKSTDGGNSWEVIKINHDLEIDRAYSLDVYNGNIYISYYEYIGRNTQYFYDERQLKFAKLNDQGSSLTFKDITTKPFDGEKISMVIFNNIIYIAYYDGYNDLVKFVISEDGGNTWH